MKPVTVYLRTTQKVEDTCDTMDLQAQGTYLCTPNKKVVTFTEATEEETVTTLLTVTNDQNPTLTMVRKGSNESRMTIKENAFHEGPYTMGPYTLTVGVRGLWIKNNLTADGGCLSAAYTLFINGQEASQNTIELSIK